MPRCPVCGGEQRELNVYTIKQEWKKMLEACPKCWEEKMNKLRKDETKNTKSSKKSTK